MVQNGDHLLSSTVPNGIWTAMPKQFLMAGRYASKQALAVGAE